MSVGAAGAEEARGTLIVLNKGDASDTLFDLSSERSIKQVEVGVGPHEVAVAPDGRRAVVANYGQQQPSSTLTVIDIAAGAPARTINLVDGERRFTRPHGVQFVDEHRVAVTAEAQQALLIVDVDSGRIERVLATGQQVSHMVALAPDRSRPSLPTLARAR
jgi:DNA-binding beta-propeller fold protein YncE